MKITIESTSQIIEIRSNGAVVPARVWEGWTNSGIHVQVLVTRIAALKTEDLAEFDRELTAQKDPQFLPSAFPLRMIL